MRTESKLLRVSWNPNDMNGEHLSPKTRELLDKPIEERIAHIQKDSWIPYSQANKILQQLEDLLQHPKCRRLARRHRIGSCFGEWHYHDWSPYPEPPSEVTWHQCSHDRGTPTDS